MERPAGRHVARGAAPESLAFSDCFRNGFERLHRYKPGLFGPCQVLFRNESRLYPAGVGAAEFYRKVLFPTKAKIDLAYFEHRTLVSDLAWILRAVWATVAGARADPPLCGEADQTEQ